MKTLKILLALLLVNLMGCAGHQTFNHLARSNDTVAVAAGWMQTFSRDRIRVTITDDDGTGTQTVYEPGDPNIRAVINLYPDPLSNIVVSRETGDAVSPGAVDYASQIDYWYTHGDDDWWQTIVYVNLPSNMTIDKDATILIESIDPVTAEVVETASSFVSIVSGVGEAAPFSAQNPWGGGSYFNMTSDNLKSLERSGHYQIDFDGTEIPAALSLEITHAAGNVFVANPTSEKKNLHWTDDGVTTKIIILPTTSAGFTDLADLKFYISGLNIDNVVVSNFEAYDQNGDVIATVTANTPTKR
ncbi:MAG: hypothetical protein OQK69_08535 [Gammaproteobacteria bacterium]|nr:hypothetical protein [Gammaproteobacteria bacterium]